ncbi:MAG TPA: hypothetical protein VMY05_03250 [Acidobacteriota bacterium]|nr:hypothetical protein [Acidobacteriota bacterium]
MEQTQKKGLSKGCLVALIIVAVLVVIIVVAGLTCWYYKDDLAKMGATTGVSGVKDLMAQTPPEGIDTAQFNALADAFLVKLNEEPLDYEKYAGFMQALQGVIDDKAISTDEAERLADAMIVYYPDLTEQYQPQEAIDTTGVIDSTVSQ